MCPICAAVRLAPTAVHLAVATAYLGSSSSGSDGRPRGRGDGTYVCMTHDDPASSLVRCQFGFLYLAVCLDFDEALFIFLTRIRLPVYKEIPPFLGGPALGEHGDHPKPPAYSVGFAPRTPKPNFPSHLPF